MSPQASQGKNCQKITLVHLHNHLYFTNTSLLHSLVIKASFNIDFNNVKLTVTVHLTDNDMYLEVALDKSVRHV